MVKQSLDQTKARLDLTASIPRTHHDGCRVLLLLLLVLLPLPLRLPAPPSSYLLLVLLAG